ncbi:hypothetical protein [Streptomyces sp. NBC_01387]|uniref:hypothetical protein n=1 Tax=Streptomyces sp. NBC_01387 TaxID=2903849 RepID=UPI003863AD27
MDVKTLAKAQPQYGKQPAAAALNALSVAGHLRRIRRSVGEGRTQWVHAAGAFVRQRLTDKMPPERMPTAPGARSGWVMECTNCGRPGAPDALPGGICAECRSLPPEEVHRRVATLREAGGLRSARTAGGESRAGVRSAQVSALRRRSGVNR